MIFNNNFGTLLATAALIGSASAAGQLRGSSSSSQRGLGDARCPAEPQATGELCLGKIPSGMQGYMCQYGPNLCECDLNQSDYWTCTDKYRNFLNVNDSGNGGTIGGRTESINPKLTPVVVLAPITAPPPNSAPVPAPVSAPVPMVSVSESEDEILSTSGSSISNVIVADNSGIVSVENKNPNCPAQRPNNGDSCTQGKKHGEFGGWTRCKYSNGDGTGVNCDCDGEWKFRCRDDNDLQAIFYTGNSP